MGGDRNANVFGVGVHMVDPNLLRPHPRYAQFNDVLKPEDPALLRIRADMEVHGIEVPLKVEEGTNVILCGHKRQRIAVELGWPTVPVRYVQPGTKDEAIDFMLMDNQSRAHETRDPVVFAEIVWWLKTTRGYKRGRPRNGENASDDGRLNDEQRAAMLGISTTRLYEYEQIHGLIPEVKVMLSADQISVRSGAALAGFSEDVQREFAARFASEGENIPDLKVKAYAKTIRARLEASPVLAGGETARPPEPVIHAGPEPTGAVDINAINPDELPEWDPDKQTLREALGMGPTPFGGEYEDEPEWDEDVDGEDGGMADDEDKGNAAQMSRPRAAGVSGVAKAGQGADAPAFSSVKEQQLFDTHVFHAQMHRDAKTIQRLNAELQVLYTGDLRDFYRQDKSLLDMAGVMDYQKGVHALMNRLNEMVDEAGDER